MKAPNPLLYLLGFIPVILGGLSLVLFYTGIEFAWIMATVAIICCLWCWISFGEKVSVNPLNKKLFIMDE